jgi:hypothetical protein
VVSGEVAAHRYLPYFFSYTVKRNIPVVAIIFISSLTLGMGGKKGPEEGTQRQRKGRMERERGGREGEFWRREQGGEHGTGWRRSLRRVGAEEGGRRREQGTDGEGVSGRQDQRRKGGEERSREQG